MINKKRDNRGTFTVQQAAEEAIRVLEPFPLVWVWRPMCA